MWQRCEGEDWSLRGPMHQGVSEKDRLCDDCREAMVKAEAEAGPLDARTWQLYAMLEADGRLHHFYPAPQICRMCGKDPIKLVRLTPDPEGPYWGWYYSFHPSNSDHRGTVSMIYSHPSGVEICFTYGTKAEVSRGRGQVTRFKAEVLADA